MSELRHSEAANIFKTTTSLELPCVLLGPEVLDTLEVEAEVDDKFYASLSE